MNIIRYNEICDYLRNIIVDSVYENHLYTVGGCVRDSILKHEIKDIDLVIDLPNGGIDFSQWLYNKSLLTHVPVVYETYGTSMFCLKQFPDVELEAVQTRKEQYKDKNSRNPETCFGTIIEDCLRRDLTINSLYYNVTSKEIIDITKRGIDDINNHLITTPCDPDITYTDDALRILRCIRFASRYKWEIDNNTFEGMIRNVDRLKIISQERITDEFNKMLLNDNAVFALELLYKTNAIKYVIPELIDTYKMSQGKYHFGTVWEHTMSVVDKLKGEDLTLKMSGLLHDIGKVKVRTVDDNGNIHFYKHDIVSADMSTSILRRMKYSNNFIKDVYFLIKNHMRTKPWGNNCENIKPKSIRKLQYECGEKYFDSLLKLIDADNLSHAKNYCLDNQVKKICELTYEMMKNDEDMLNYTLPVNGDDIMKALYLPPSEKIKRYIEIVKKICYKNPKITKEDCIKQIKNIRL